MPKRVVLIGVLVNAAIAMLLTAALASAETLRLSVGDKPALHEPLSVTAEGSADGAHRLYAYVDPGAEVCAPNPQAEATERFGVALISSSKGDLLSVGFFARPYTYVPEVNDAYSVCGYLDDLPTDPPDAVAVATFGVPSGPVEPTYLEAAADELKHIAVEHEQQELAAQAKLRQEREELERIPASELPQSGAASPQGSALVGAGAAARCIVPLLKGHTLARARVLLLRAHCRLGKVERPSRARGALDVTRQGVRHGRVLSAGAAVAVGLGPATR
jgi:hypothetical protein